MEYKLGNVNFMRESDSRKIVQPVFRATGISDDWYRSAMELIVVSLGTYQSVRYNV